MLTPCNVLWLVSGVWEGHRSRVIPKLYSVPILAIKERKSRLPISIHQTSSSRTGPIHWPPYPLPNSRVRTPTSANSLLHLLPSSSSSQNTGALLTKLTFCPSPAQSFLAGSHCLPLPVSAPFPLSLSLASSTTQISFQFSHGPRSSVGTLPSDLHPSCSPP